MSFIATMMESYCTVLRPTVSRDEAQGTVYTHNITIREGIACNLGQAGFGAQMVYAQQSTFISATLYFAEDPFIQPDDIIVVTTPRLNNQENTYLSKGRSQPLGRGHTWMANVELIEQPTQTIP